MFLGNIYPKISEIIDSEDIDSKSYTWIGDKNIAEKLNIELSEYSLKSESNTLIENVI